MNQRGVDPPCRLRRARIVQGEEVTPVDHPFLRNRAAARALREVPADDLLIELVDGADRLGPER